MQRRYREGEASTHSVIGLWLIVLNVRRALADVSDDRWREARAQLPSPYRTARHGARSRKDCVRRSYMTLRDRIYQKLATLIDIVALVPRVIAFEGIF
jgi:hypothetical protein